MSSIKCLTASLVLFAWAAAREPAYSAEIAVSQAQIDRLEIRLEEARTATEEAVALLPATVIPPMNSRVAVPAPFAGTVVSVQVLPGQTVEQGRTLMTIASRELVETLSRLHQAEANLAAAAAVAGRYRALAEKNIASPFTTWRAEGHGHDFGKASVQERVRGRVARGVLVLILPRMRLSSVLEDIRSKEGIPNLDYWTEPIEAFGRLTQVDAAETKFQEAA